MKAALMIKNLCKKYRGGTQALESINLTVDKGDFFALLGPNGAGKSTLIGIVTSLVSKTSGQVEIFGHDIDVNFAKAKSYLGVIPQEFNFDPGDTAMDTLIKAAGFHGVRRKDAIKKAKINLALVELSNKKNKTIRQLSGGMKRRLMIARALMHEPRFLILDEPTAGIDIEQRQLIWKLLSTLNEKGVTIILTTHYLEEAEMLCKNVAVIHQGKILKQARMHSLLRQLNKQTLVLELADTVNIENLKTPLHYKQQGPCTLEVSIDGDHPLNDLFVELKQNNIDVLTIKNKTNRLEEFFLDLLAEHNEEKESA